MAVNWFGTNILSISRLSDFYGRAHGKYPYITEILLVSQGITPIFLTVGCYFSTNQLLCACTLDFLTVFGCHLSPKPYAPTAETHEWLMIEGQFTFFQTSWVKWLQLFKHFKQTSHKGTVAQNPFHLDRINHRLP